MANLMTASLRASATRALRIVDLVLSFLRLHAGRKIDVERRFNYPALLTGSSLPGVFAKTIPKLM